MGASKDGDLGNTCTYGVHWDLTHIKAMGIFKCAWSVIIPQFTYSDETQQHMVEMLWEKVSKNYWHIILFKKEFCSMCFIIFKWFGRLMLESLLAIQSIFQMEIL